MSIYKKEVKTIKTISIGRKTYMNMSKITSTKQNNKKSLARDVLKLSILSLVITVLITSLYITIRMNNLVVTVSEDKATASQNIVQIKIDEIRSNLEKGLNILTSNTDFISAIGEEDSSTTGYSYIMFDFKNENIGSNLTITNTEGVVIASTGHNSGQTLFNNPLIKEALAGIAFHFLNPVFSAVLNSTGNSVTPFKTNTIGLIVNIVIDPLLIFGFGPFPSLGIKGAALATILAQFLVTLIFLIIGKKYDTIYSNAKIISKPNFQFVKDIIKVGFPPCVQVGIHALISIIVTRILSVFGPMAIAVQSIGSQIESVTWMTTEGFSAAISAFVGQNYGAGKIKRIKEGYKKGIQIVGGIGLFATILLIFAAEPLFTIFTPDDLLAIKEGIVYLRILGLSQFLMAIEIGTTGAFNGLGKTIYPTANGIVLNVLRIPAALALSKTALGLSGVWWAISISSNLKGLVLFVLFYFYRKHFEEINKRLG
jgi:putative MATE family efflux protein